MKIEHRFQVEHQNGHWCSVVIASPGYGPYHEYNEDATAEVVSCGSDKALADAICADLNAVLDQYENNLPD